MNLSQIQESLANAEGPRVTYDRCLGSIRFGNKPMDFQFPLYFIVHDRRTLIVAVCFYLTSPVRLLACTNPIRFMRLNPIRVTNTPVDTVSLLFTAKQNKHQHIQSLTL